MNRMAVKLEGMKVPVKLWTDWEGIEEGAKQQLINAASLPFVFKHIATMPDCHYGRGFTVGTVMATKGAVCPAAVGVDIGCGMYAVKTVFRADEVIPKAAELRHSIERSIPTGFNMNKEPSNEVKDWTGWQSFGLVDKAVSEVKVVQERAKLQLGTLGGGNHFIEVSQDAEGIAWVILHTGSRHVGLRIASLYLDRAKELMQRMFIHLPDPELSYLPLHTEMGDDYMRDLNWAQSYAWMNRNEIMRLVLKDLRYAVGKKDVNPWVSEVHCHHNYAGIENHFGENVVVTRKGAVRARAGEMGIIPGSMGTKSFITRGLGNAESFHSSSHGAGRRMSRSAARRMFKKEDIEQQTQGIECRKDEGIIDELPGSYKDIDQVMASQVDLVEVVAELKQILCVKGGGKDEG